jgi:hypothetical protein
MSVRWLLAGVRAEASNTSPAVVTRLSKRSSRAAGDA